MNEETEVNISVEDIEDMNQGRRSSDDWVVKHWPVLVTMGLAIIAFVTVQMTSLSNSKTTSDNETDINKITLMVNNIQNEVKVLTEKNYRLYLQFDEFKKSNKADLKDVTISLSNLTISVNTLVTQLRSLDKNLDAKFKNLDNRYPLRRELDARQFKTAFRDKE